MIVLFYIVTCFNHAYGIKGREGLFRGLQNMFNPSPEVFPLFVVQVTYDFQQAPFISIGLPYVRCFLVEAPNPEDA